MNEEPTETWIELIERWKKVWKENPPELNRYWMRGFHGAKFIALLSSPTLTHTSSDMSWLYWNFLACEYDPPCPFPPLDEVVPLNPLMAPPGLRPGRRACRRHALSIIDPLHNYMYEEGEL